LDYGTIADPYKRYYAHEPTTVTVYNNDMISTRIIDIMMFTYQIY